MAIVYVVTNVLNGKRYVGQTSTTLKQRRWKHENMAGRPDHDHHFTFQRALAKHGFENFVWEQVFESDDQAAVDFEEVRLIKEYQTMDGNGYNERPGGKSKVGTGPVEVTCKECNTIFHVDFGHYNRNLKIGRGFVCSKECMSNITSRVVGPQLMGENNGASKMSNTDIEEVLRLSDEGWRQTDLAKKFGVTQSRISRLISSRRP